MIKMHYGIRLHEYFEILNVLVRDELWKMFDINCYMERGREPWCMLEVKRNTIICRKNVWFILLRVWYAYEKESIKKKLRCITKREE